MAHPKVKKKILNMVCLGLERCRDFMAPHHIIPVFAPRGVDLILDAQLYREGMDLMVHCNAGQRRSPAVAGGLNDIFTLGHDRFLNDHPDFNRHVYWTMIDTAIAERLLSDEQQQRFNLRRPH